MLVRKALFANGFRYRLHSSKLPGKPDIILKKYKTAIFINGCFWHGHVMCKNAKKPKTNAAFWHDKISKNIARDEANISSLRALGWLVKVVWECELSKQNFATRINELVLELKAAKKQESADNQH